MSTFQLQLFTLEAFVVVLLVLLTSFATYVVISMANQPTVGFVEHVRWCLDNRIVKVIRKALVAVCVPLVVFVIIVVVSAIWPTPPPKPPALVDAEIVKVDLKQYSIGDRNTTLVSTGDSERFKALTEIVSVGIPTDDHKCGNGGRISFRFADGKSLELGILAGHDERYYEYRVYSSDHDGYSMFRVDRTPFLAALANLGEPTPERDKSR